MSPRSNQKTSNWSEIHLKKHVTSMSPELKSAIWSRDIGQQILCLDRCQLTITWTPSIKEKRYISRLYFSVKLLAGVWPPFFARLVRTRSQAILLATITMRKSIQRFPLLSYMGVGPSSRQRSAKKSRMLIMLILLLCTVETWLS